jgi:hypothetical protein
VLKLTFAPAGGTTKTKTARIRVVAPKRRSHKVVVDPGARLKGVPYAGNRAGRR